MSFAGLASLADAFVAAAAGSLPWECVMDTAGPATGGVCAILLPLRGELPSTPFSTTHREGFETYLKAGWARRDPRRRSANLLAQRAVVSDLDAITSDEIARDPFYQEHLPRYGLKWFAGIKVAAGDEVWCLAVQRSIVQGPFQKDDLRRLAALSPQLSSSAALARALGFARAASALAAFEASGTPVVLLDRHGLVQSTNPAADRLFGPHLNVRQGRLTSWSRAATRALDRALHRLYWDSEEPVTARPVVLPRPEGKPVIAYPCRLRGVTSDTFGLANAVVVLNDLALEPTTDQELLRQIYRLTPAEARFAVHVGRGDPLRAAADELGVSYETARSTLKSIMHKTDTHRQAELAMLLGRIAKRPV